MMKYFLYILLGYTINCFSQQTGQFTQYTFNKYGYNPAAAGTNINSKLEVIAGIRKQWIGFPNAPSATFFSGNYTFKPERSYKRWHNAGIYISNEKVGAFQNFAAYGSYTLHMPLTYKYNISFGIFLGVRRFSLTNGILSPYDPVYDVTSPINFFAYPDFIPGIRIYNKKMFFDISVQQIYKNRREQGYEQIGHQSFLVQQLYVTYGKRFFLENGFTLVPSVNMHTSYISIPSVELNIMAFYVKRIGIGVSIRNKDFISGILQLRFGKKSMIGFSYDYSINKFNSLAPSTLEFMIGLTPLMMMEASYGKNRSNKCPNFDFN